MTASASRRAALWIAMVLPLVFGCESRERCAAAHDGTNYGGHYKPARLAEGASLAPFESCEQSSDCATGQSCATVYLEECFSETLCGISADFECPADHHVAVLESDPSQIVCAPNNS